MAERKRRVSNKAKSTNKVLIDFCFYFFLPFLVAGAFVFDLLVFEFLLVALVLLLLLAARPWRVEGFWFDFFVFSFLLLFGIFVFICAFPDLPSFSFFEVLDWQSSSNNSCLVWLMVLIMVSRFTALSGFSRVSATFVVVSFFMEFCTNSQMTRSRV